MTCGIYEIVNTFNGKRYVGSSVDIEERRKNHLWRLARGYHHSTYLQRSWVKYGSDSFAFNILLECGPDELHPYEQIEIDIKSEYNVAPIAGSTRGHRWTEDQKAAHSNSKLEYYDGNDEARASISAGVRLAQSRPEVIKAISDGTKLAHSRPEVRKKLSDNTRERWLCPDYRSDMSEMASRNINRPEHKAAILLANKKPRNTSIYRFHHKDHGYRICTQWSLKKEFTDLRSGNISQLCSGEKGSHMGWTIKKAPEGA